MNTIKVVNIKCGGCENNIKASLSELGLKNIEVDILNQSVSFDGDIEIAKNKLIEMGYPPANSKEAGKFIKKVKSYLSCMVGKIK